MSAQAAPNSDSAVKSTVESIITELIDINSEIFELKEEIVAKGIPFATVNALVDLARAENAEELENLRNNSLQAAVAQYGVGAISAELLDQHLQKLVELEEDLGHVRKLAKGNNLEPQAVNLLTQVIRQNPGDGGTRVVGKIIEYARACGISIANVQLVASNEPAPVVSVLPSIELPVEDAQGLRSYRKLAAEIALGLLIAVVALTLLT